MLIQLIRNGRLSDQCRTYLLSCPVIPTVKHNGGIRPVTIGETFYKMAAVIALHDIEEVAVELLGPDQYALRPGAGVGYYRSQSCTGHVLGHRLTSRMRLIP